MMFSFKSRETAQTQTSVLFTMRYSDYNRQNDNCKHGNSKKLRGYGQYISLFFDEDGGSRFF
jgi:hypothetical protein